MDLSNPEGNLRVQQSNPSSGSSNPSSSLPPPLPPPASASTPADSSCPIFDVTESLGVSVGNIKKRLEDCALVLYNLGRPITDTAISSWIQAEVVAKGGEVEGMWTLGKGYSTLLFKEASTRDRILLQGPWTIGGTYVYLTPWIPGFNVLEANSNLCPIIVDFLNVPIELRPFIRELASKLGKVLHVQDEGWFSKRPAMKTVVVYDLSKPILSKVSYKIGDEVFTLDVNFLNVPNRCNLCKDMGHMVRECPSMAPPVPLSSNIRQPSYTRGPPPRGPRDVGLLPTPPVTPLRPQPPPPRGLVDKDGFQRVQRRRNIFPYNSNKGSLPPLAKAPAPRSMWVKTNQPKPSTSHGTTLRINEPTPSSSTTYTIPLIENRKGKELMGDVLSPIKASFKDILDRGLMQISETIIEEDVEVVPESQTILSNSDNYDKSLWADVINACPNINSS